MRSEVIEQKPFFYFLVTLALTLTEQCLNLNFYVNLLEIITLQHRMSSFCVAAVKRRPMLHLSAGIIF
jgi:hypothetical protein